MIQDPHRTLRRMLRTPPLAAYAVTAAVVFLGRELELIGDLLAGTLNDAAASPGGFLDATAANALIGAVWPTLPVVLESRLLAVGVFVLYAVVTVGLWRADAAEPTTRPADPRGGSGSAGAGMGGSRRPRGNR